MQNGNDFQNDLINFVEINSVIMPYIPPVMSLHLRYRLWIVEMNSDITILRIFDDYLSEIAARKNAPEVKTKIDYFENLFVSVRKDIDYLRHEMHLLKMKLGAFSKQMKPLSYKTYQADKNPLIKKQYVAFRKIFNKAKNEFIQFEAEFLN